MRKRWIENTLAETSAESSINASFQTGWDASRNTVQ
jgi:OFA family oxalate/formate antiporter-like MFS transporter